MSLTKPVNSKSNIKQYSNADLPVQPRQPVVARYAAESTLNQTVINLPFQVDTVNAADSFMLTVDGKVLTPGLTNDFTFTAIDSFGFSSTVTLVQSIPASLNIQAIKLGLKKETEFLQDARFTQLYESQDQALQGFIRTADVITATTTTGTPATGTFYSSITNRASIVDLSKDLKVRMGIERIMTQQIYQLQNEFGSSGEPVWATPNDDRGQIRFVGSWSNFNSSQGTFPIASSQNDFVEITFYGTGLNLLYSPDSTARDYRYTVDGGTESSNFYIIGSNVLTGRNYAQNQLGNVVTGLSLGIHTIKIRNASASQNMFLYGFEVLNESSTLKVNPGSTYLAGKKITTLAQQSPAYNSGFETGTLGSRGGRVLVYQKSDGSIAKAVTPTDASSLTYPSVVHTNEEAIRPYHWREFGAGRSDDFSLLTSASTNVNVAFSLDDGTTTLTGIAVTPHSTLNGVTPTTNSASSLIFTFVGTGLDVEFYIDSAGTNTNANAYTYTIDGGSQINLPTVSAGAGAFVTLKVASGLPYGTHTFKLIRNVPNVFSYFIRKLIPYQPKKPSLPSGAVELADYNIMATYVASSSTTSNVPSTGVLAKSMSREVIPTGTWTAITQRFNDVNLTSFSLDTTTTGQTLEYTFFGTGIEFGMYYANNPCSVTVQIDGAAYTGAATVSNSSFMTWTPGTSTALVTGGSSANLQISSLSLGKHTIKLTVASIGASATLAMIGFQIITPIHSYKSNIYADLQNTLSVGSNAISDNRKTSAIKEALPAQKAWAQAIRISSLTTTSTSYVPTGDLSCTVKVGSNGRLKISANMGFRNSVAGTDTYLGIFVNGVQVGIDVNRTIYTGAASDNLTTSLIVPISAGTHKVDVYWKNNGGTSTLFPSILTVEEL